MLERWLPVCRRGVWLVQWLGPRLDLTLVLLVVSACLVLITANGVLASHEQFALVLNSETDPYKLAASDGAVGDFFGHAASANGDTIVLGAHWDDDLGDGSGSAYVFVRSDPGWTQEAKLTANDGTAGDGLGQTVSISGDTVVASALGDDDSGGSGSAYVFVRNGTVWTQQAILIASDAAPLDGFGFAAISGDTIVVGAHNDDDRGDSSGSAYIFVRNGTAWSQQAKLVAGDGAAGDHFGWSVAISGDVAVIGALDDDDYGESSGSSYVFVRTGTSWFQQAKLTPDDGGAGDTFGSVVAISGDLVVVGAPYNDDNGSNSGSAYVFARSGADWPQEAKLVNEDGAASDFFGWSLAVSEDMAVVGAYGDDDKGEGSGSAYVFVRDLTGWGQYDKLTASDGAAGDSFGISAAISGNVTVVGAPYDDQTTGSAYVFEVLYEPCPDPLASAQIVGPSTGYTNVAYQFTASITPITATEPVSYTWWPEPVSGQGMVSAWYEWTDSGMYSITLEAENCGAMFSDTHGIAISTKVSVYLPLIVRNYTPATILPEVSIEYIRYDTADEYLRITNEGTSSQNMTGWEIQSVVDNQWYRFPVAYVLEVGASVYIHSGPSGYEDPPIDLLWTNGYIWADSGDKAILNNEDGHEVDSYCYGGGCP